MSNLTAESLHVKMHSVILPKKDLVKNKRQPHRWGYLKIGWANGRHLKWAGRRHSALPALEEPCPGLVSLRNPEPWFWASIARLLGLTWFGPWAVQNARQVLKTLRLPNRKKKGFSGVLVKPNVTQTNSGLRNDLPGRGTLLPNVQKGWKWLELWNQKGDRRRRLL